MSLTLEQLNVAIARYNAAENEKRKEEENSKKIEELYREFDKFDTTHYGCKCEKNEKSRIKTAFGYYKCIHHYKHEMYVHYVSTFDERESIAPKFYAESLDLSARKRYGMINTCCTCPEGRTRGTWNPTPCEHLCLLYHMKPTKEFEKRFRDTSEEYIQWLIKKSASRYKIYPADSRRTWFDYKVQKFGPSGEIL